MKAYPGERSVRRRIRRLAQAVVTVALLLPAIPAAAAPGVSTVPPPGGSAGSKPPIGAAGLPAPRPLAGVPTTPAVSPALAAARTAAAELAAKVADLQAATESAVERYNQVAADLKVAHARHERAVRELRTARAVQARADRIADDRARTIYMSGGPPGLLDLTIGSAPDMDAFHSFDDTGFFAAADRRRFDNAAAAAAVSAAAERVAAATLSTQQRLAREAAAARSAVQAKLAAEQQLLASASARVRAVLAAEQRAQAQAADALAAMLRAAQRTVGPGVALLADTTPLAEARLSPFVVRVLAAAEAQLGKPYQWGATGPASYDCSGLVQHAFAAAGVALPRTAAQQWSAGTHPVNTGVKPGDLLFWANGNDPATIHHVAIYLGSGYMIAAPHTGTVVQVQPVYYDGFFGVTRVLPPAGR